MSNLVSAFVFSEGDKLLATLMKKHPEKVNAKQSNLFVYIDAMFWLGCNFGHWTVAMGNPAEKKSDVFCSSDRFIT